MVDWPDEVVSVIVMFERKPLAGSPPSVLDPRAVFWILIATRVSLPEAEPELLPPPELEVADESMDVTRYVLFARSSVVIVRAAQSTIVAVCCET